MAVPGPARADDPATEKADEILKDLDSTEPAIVIAAVHRAKEIASDEMIVALRVLLEARGRPKISPVVEDALVAIGPPAALHLARIDLDTVRGFNVIHRIGRPAIPAVVQAMSEHDFSSLGHVALNLFLDEAIGELTKLLGSDDAPTRSVGVRYLAYTQHPRAMVELVNVATRDPDPHLRSAAVRHLSTWGPPPQRDGADMAVLAARKDPAWEVRLAAAIALGRRGDPSVANALTEALISEEAWVDRPAVLQAMWEIGTKDLRQRVRSACTSKDPSVRVAAIGILAKAKVPGMLDKLLALLEETDGDRRNRAPGFEVIHELGRVRSARAVKPLLRILPDPDYGRTSCRALGQIGSHEATGPLCDLVKADLSRGEPSNGGWGAVSALGDIGDPNAVPTLIKVMESDPEKFGFLTGNAAVSLGEIRHPSARGALIRALTRNNVHLRFMATTSLKRFNGPATRKALAKAMADPVLIVRRQAARSLKELRRSLR